MAEAAAHGTAIAQAIKASCVVVRVETVDFLRLLNRQDEPIVVRSPGGFFQAPWRYLTTYKGLAFVADSGFQASGCLLLRRIIERPVSTGAACEPTSALDRLGGRSDASAIFVAKRFAKWQAELFPR